AGIAIVVSDSTVHRCVRRCARVVGIALLTYDSVVDVTWEVTGTIVVATLGRDVGDSALQRLDAVAERADLRVHRPERIPDAEVGAALDHEGGRRQRAER